MKRLVFVALVAACNSAFGIEATRQRDALVVLDQDDDGTADSVDNCIDTPNDQSDADQDRVGDVCDNCPLVANRQQEREGDSDPVGDACDPHARTPGDCLILLDVLSDAAAFSSRWRIDANMPPTIAHGDGVVMLTPVDAAPVTILPLDADGVFAGVFDTQIMGSARLMMGSVYAMSNISSPGSGYGCGMRFDTTISLYRPMAHSGSSPSANFAFPGFLATDPVDASLLLQLITPTEVGAPVLCLATYGLAAGAASWIPANAYSPGPGEPGVVITGDPVTLDAIALYRMQPGECPAPVYR